MSTRSRQPRRESEQASTILRMSAVRRGAFLRQRNQSSDHLGHPSQNSVWERPSLEEVLLKPLKEQQGIKSLVFIDACAADLKFSVEQARDIVSDLTPTEFEALVHPPTMLPRYSPTPPMRRPIPAMPT